MMNLPPLSDFQFLAPRQIVFGAGSRHRLATLAAGLGQRAWIVAAPSSAAGANELAASLAAGNIPCGVVTTARGEPTVADVDQLVAELRSRGAAAGDFIVGLGGGSALDRAKAAAALVAQPIPASCRDYLEGVGCGRKLVEPPLPLVAIPTTAGTGSEATKNAVISVADPPCKKSLRDDAMLARLVIVDPELTLATPRDVTIASGLDAITQLIEAFVSRRATAFTRALALDGLHGAVPALRRAVAAPDDLPARSRMSYAALLSGLALANGGLGLAHGVAAALGSNCAVAHGLACAMLLPAAMRFNLSHRTADFAAIARAIEPHINADDAYAAEAGVAAIESLVRELGVPARLSAVGVRGDQLAALVIGSRGNSMDGNPRDVSDAQLLSILEGLL